MSESGEGGNGPSMVWLWRALVGVTMSGLFGLGIKGCEFRDETRDRLTQLERNQSFIREASTNQGSSLAALEERVNQRGDYIIRQIEQINEKLGMMLPNRPMLPERPYGGNR